MSWDEPDDLRADLIGNNERQVPPYFRPDRKGAGVRVRCHRAFIRLTVIPPQRFVASTPLPLESMRSAPPPFSLGASSEVTMRKFAPIITVLLILGCGEPSETVPAGSSPASAGEGHMPFELTEAQQEGWVIYETMCWTCHGVSGRGDGPAIENGSSTAPSSFHTLDYARASTESLLRRFRGGAGGTEPAPAHMQYVASILEPEHFAHALSFIPVLVFPPEIPGSALAGKHIFDDRQFIFNCSA